MIHYGRLAALSLENAAQMQCFCHPRHESVAQELWLSFGTSGK